MNDPLPYNERKSDRGEGLPRWVKVSGLILALLVLIVVLVVVIGGGGDGGGHQSPIRH
jgi:hypothetical protein